MAFEQFMKSVPPLDAVEDAMGYESLQGLSTEGAKNGTDVHGLKADCSHTAALGRTDLIPTESVMSTVHVVRINTAVHALSTELP